jgi:hypothetical protein
MNCYPDGNNWLALSGLKVRARRMYRADSGKAAAAVQEAPMTKLLLVLILMAPFALAV